MTKLLKITKMGIIIAGGAAAGIGTALTSDKVVTKFDSKLTNKWNEKAIEGKLTSEQVHRRRLVLSGIEGFTEGFAAGLSAKYAMIGLSKIVKLG